MGRWVDLEGDENRLPEGFKRVGYDADKETYTFEDANGKLYEGQPGNRFGKLRPVARDNYPHPETAFPADDPEYRDDPNWVNPFNTPVMAGTDEAKRQNREAVRMMLPFVLLVLVMLLILFKMLNGGNTTGAVGNGDKSDNNVQVHCAEGSNQVQIQEGDTCWKLANEHGIRVEELVGLKGNEKVECESLGVGQAICVPV